MRVLHSLEEATRAAGLLRQPVATIGVFDGVHRGHQHLLARLVDWARARGGADPAVVTFRSHPLEVLASGVLAPGVLASEVLAPGVPGPGVPGQRPPALLGPLSQRLKLLERHGVQVALVLDFDSELASWSPERFVQEVLVRGLGCRALLMGHDAAFGAGARGTARYLAERALPIEIRSVEPFLLDGKPISSTGVRAAIVQGDLARAARLLGRPVTLCGQVVRGDGRGRRLGFPTANLALSHRAVPPGGVYLATVHLQGTRYGALVNIGRRPTFQAPEPPGAGEAEAGNWEAGNGKAGERGVGNSSASDGGRAGGAVSTHSPDSIEVYLHGFDGDLYGQELEVELTRKLRDERRFADAAALIAQIRQDVLSLEPKVAEAQTAAEARSTNQPSSGP